MAITALAHACIRTRDLDTTERFYTAVLGLRRQFRFMRKGRMIGVYLHLADRMFIEIFDAAEVPETTQAHALGHICFECDDIEALHRRVAEAGFSPGPVKLGADRTRQFWAKDPNGIPLEFQQYTPESAQFRTEDVEVNW